MRKVVTDSLYKVEGNLTALKTDPIKAIAADEAPPTMRCSVGIMFRLHISTVSKIMPHIWDVNIKAHCYQLSVLLSTASTLVLINAPSPCLQPRASAAAAAAAAAAHKQRSLVVVTSLSSLSIFASILFTHLFLNIYPTPIVQ